MLAKVLAPAMAGIDGVIVEVECDITNGLPSLVMVGLGNQAVHEARDRVRSAIRNSNLLLPPKRITLNLAPADLPKDGTTYDVSIAVAILLASGQIEHTGNSLFVGELALDGSLRPIRGALAYAQMAATRGIEYVVVPTANAAEAALIEGITVYGADNLIDIYGHLLGLQPLTPHSLTKPVDDRPKRRQIPDMAHIYGQAEAKRAIEIAAAGGHNLFLSGSPGAGKTMLSRALIGILPPPTLEEMIEITKLHSLAGQTIHGVQSQRPFRNPHHTASDVALIGGGRIPRPGEISLSHHGVLFLDEIPEFRREVLDVLRQPLEDGQVTIARAASVATFPARFILVAAQNPCPCGFAGDPQRECSCTQNRIINYNQRISGPLLDRIDLTLTVHPLAPETLRNPPSEEPSTAVAKRVLAARTMQTRRNPNQQLNAHLSGADIRQIAQLQPDAKRILDQASEHLRLSARGYMRLLKVARTIADIANSTTTGDRHITEAIQYRPIR